MQPIPLNTGFGRAAWCMLFMGAYGIAVIIGLKDYIQPLSVNFILGTIALMTVSGGEKTAKHPGRFAFAALLFAALYLWIPAKTILFASIGMAVFFTVESLVCRINYLTISCLLSMSPIADYATNLFSFPVRLWLSAVAGEIVQIADPATTVEGNSIITGQAAFSVDPACMGLHMLVASLLAGVILFSLVQRKESRKTGGFVFIACLLIIFLFNMVSNLFRILCLVHFNIGQDSFMHEVTGIACFVVYVLGPAAFIIRYSIRRFGVKENNGISLQTVQSSRARIWQNAGILLVTFMTIAVGRNKSVNDGIAVSTLTIPGYSTTLLPGRITKLQNSEALIYIKPIAGFYASDHQPMICWRGSGYEFKRVREKYLDNVSVYAAVLQKSNDILYTAWWYDNGAYSTISQLEWRWNSLKKGDNYALINVTTDTEEALDREISKLIATRPVGRILSSR